MKQQRQLNECLLLHRSRLHSHQRLVDDDDDDDDAGFSGVVVVKETGTCRGHVTDISQMLDDVEETASNGDSGASSLAMSTASDNGLDSFSVFYVSDINNMRILALFRVFPHNAARYHKRKSDHGVAKTGQ